MTIQEAFVWIAVIYGLIELSLVKRGVLKGVEEKVDKNESIL